MRILFLFIIFMINLYASNNLNDYKLIKIVTSDPYSNIEKARSRSSRMFFEEFKKRYLEPYVCDKESYLEVKNQIKDFINSNIEEVSIQDKKNDLIYIQFGIKKSLIEEEYLVIFDSIKYSYCRELDENIF